METDQTIIKEYKDFLSTNGFPCVAARESLKKDQIKCMVANHMGCPSDDHTILEFIYNFVDDYRKSLKSFHSAAVIFKGPYIDDEQIFDKFLWSRLTALSELDKQKYAHDSRVNENPESKDYSFSLKAEAFFILGLNPASNRHARQFKYPTLIFNPHAEFEKLRKEDRYNKMKNVVRDRDMVYSGSVNPMLQDFGEASEVFQYSGIRYSTDWKCPLKNRNAENK